jgi:hypothetical protein
MDKEIIEEKSTKWSYFYWGLLIFLVIQIGFFMWISNLFN